MNLLDILIQNIRVWFLTKSAQSMQKYNRDNRTYYIYRIDLGNGRTKLIMRNTSQLSQINRRLKPYERLDHKWLLENSIKIIKPLNKKL